jgi:hypothetical protein
VWVVLGANVVAVVWTVAVDNRTFGFVLAGWLTVLWLAAPASLLLSRLPTDEFATSLWETWPLRPERRHLGVCG